jgi:1-acyl-sn-glycerol-3-phosphate acyltransferase
MAEEKYTVPVGNRLARLFLLPLLKLLMWGLSRITITGRENIPANGAYIIAINHVSLYEAPLVIPFWPRIPEALGAVDIWKRHGQSTMAQLFGGIQVHRGEFDRQAVAKALAALQDGRPLLIAPEGGRSHTPGMRRGKPGVAYLMDQANVPVLPVGIVGTTSDFLERALRFKRPRLEMRIGKPIRLPAIEGRGEERRQARQRNVDIIMLAIADLLPPEYRGVYADASILDQPYVEP